MCGARHVEAEMRILRLVALCAIAYWALTACADHFEREAQSYAAAIQERAP
jgi:hypothetical protein